MPQNVILFRKRAIVGVISCDAVILEWVGR